MARHFKSIAVLISGNGSNLQALIDQIEQGKVNAKITAVFSNEPDAYGLERAKQASIQAVCVDHRDYACRDDYDLALMQKIDEYCPDLIVLAGFMRILTRQFVHHYLGRLLNVHPSLLPKYKGLHTHKRAIQAGDQEHGASVHFVTPELDGGPIIIQSKVPIFEYDDENELAERVQVQERLIYPMVVNWYCCNRLVMQDGKAVLDGHMLPPNGYAAD